MTLRRALFESSEADENDDELVGSKRETSIASAASGSPLMDSLAFIGQHVVKAKPKESISSILEQLDNLELNAQVNPGRRVAIAQAAETFKDPQVVDSLGAIFGQESRPAANNKTNLLQNRPQLNQTSRRFTSQPQQEGQRRKLTAKHPSRQGPIRSTNMTSAGGILGTLALSGGGIGVLDQKLPGKREAVAQKVAKNHSHPAVAAVSNQQPRSILEGAVVSRKTASSPDLSPALKQPIKRVNHQQTPSTDAKMMECSPQPHAPVCLEESPMRSSNEKLAMSEKLPVQRLTFDQAAIRPDLSLHAHLASQRNGLLHGLPSKGLLPSAETEVPEPLATREFTSEPSPNRLGPKHTSYNLQMATELQGKVVFLVPEPASPDPIIDPASLKVMAMEESMKDIIGMELVWRDSSSISTCSLTHAMQWDEDDDDDSAMAVASPTVSPNEKLNELKLEVSQRNEEANELLCQSYPSTAQQQENKTMAEPNKGHQPSSAAAPIVQKHVITDSTKYDGRQEERQLYLPSSATPLVQQERGTNSLAGCVMGNIGGPKSPQLSHEPEYDDESTMAKSAKGSCGRLENVDERHAQEEIDQQASIATRPKRSHKPTDHYKPETCKPPDEVTHSSARCKAPRQETAPVDGSLPSAGSLAVTKNRPKRDRKLTSHYTPEAPKGKPDTRHASPQLSAIEAIIGHEGPLTRSFDSWKGCKWNVRVVRQSGSSTWEPLKTIGKDNPAICAVYAKRSGLWDTDGWKFLHRFLPVPFENHDGSMMTLSSTAADKHSEVSCTVVEGAKEQRRKSARIQGGQHASCEETLQAKDGRKDRCRKIESPTPDDDNEDIVSVNGWTETQLAQLKKAQRSADPLSVMFWEDIAAHVIGKSASDCCSRWMAMFPTPAANARQRSKKDKLKQSLLDDGVDNLFDATPWRGRALELRLPADFDLGSAIKLETSFDESSAGGRSEVDVHNWKPRAGMGKYVQEMTRAVRRLPPKKKNGAKLQESKRPKELRERLDTDGVNMDVRMTPGGTLNFKCMRDDNEDDCFSDYYGSDKEEEDIL